MVNKKVESILTKEAYRQQDEQQIVSQPAHESQANETNRTDPAPTDLFFTVRSPMEGNRSLLEEIDDLKDEHLLSRS